MLDKDSVLNAHSISGNPSRGSTETAKSPPHDHEVSLSHDRSRFVLERWRKALDEIEQPLTTRRDMSAVLNVLMPGTVLNRLGWIGRTGLEKDPLKHWMHFSKSDYAVLESAAILISSAVDRMSC
jgi:hypothetical protein